MESITGSSNFGTVIRNGKQYILKMAAFGRPPFTQYTCSMFMIGTGTLTEGKLIGTRTYSEDGGLRPPTIYSIHWLDVHDWNWNFN